MEDLKFPDDVTVKEALEIMLVRCKADYFGSGLYKGEDYFLCAGDCQSCSVREVLRFLLDVIE